MSGSVYTTFAIAGSAFTTYAIAGSVYNTFAITGSAFDTSAFTEVSVAFLELVCYALALLASYIA